MMQAREQANQARTVYYSTEDQQAYAMDFDLGSIPSSAELTRMAMEATSNGSPLKPLLYFTDISNAESYRSVVRPNKDGADQTIPDSVSAQQMHVQLLIQAFNSITGCNDNPQMLTPFRERRHDSKLVEVLCWTLLKKCIMRSLSDHPLVLAYEPAKARESPEIGNFAQRFDQIVKALAKSKTICKHLYDSPYIHVFVDDPTRAIRRVDANRYLNRQKGRMMDKGKEVLEQESKATGGQISESTPRKRQANVIHDEAAQSPVSEKKARRKSRATTTPVNKVIPSYKTPASSTSVLHAATDSVGSYSMASSTRASTGMGLQDSPLSHLATSMDPESPKQADQKLSYSAAPAPQWPLGNGTIDHGDNAATEYNPANGHIPGNSNFNGQGGGNIQGRARSQTETRIQGNGNGNGNGNFHSRAYSQTEIYARDNGNHPSYPQSNGRAQGSAYNPYGQDNGNGNFHGRARSQTEMYANDHDNDVSYHQANGQVQATGNLPGELDDPFLDGSNGSIRGGPSMSGLQGSMLNTPPNTVQEYLRRRGITLQLLPQAPPAPPPAPMFPQTAPATTAAMSTPTVTMQLPNLSQLLAFSGMPVNTGGGATPGYPAIGNFAVSNPVMEANPMGHAMHQYNTAAFQGANGSNGYGLGGAMTEAGNEIDDDGADEYTKYEGGPHQLA